MSLANIVVDNPAKAAQVSAEVRTERQRQRRELRTLPVREVVRRIITPTPELAGMRLGALLAPSHPPERPIPGFGRSRFDEVMRTMRQAEGNESVDSRTRLGQLSVSQRRQLVGAVIRTQPPGWSGSRTSPAQPNTPERSTTA